MATLYPWLLFLHVALVVVGLGPTFIFGRITAAAARQPSHALFTARLLQSLSTRWTHPLAGLVFLTGLGLIWLGRIDVFGAGWLLVSIVLFVAAFSYAAFVQNRDIARIIELSSTPPPLLREHEEELVRRRRRARSGGLLMRVSTVIILLLMVIKPF